MQIMKNQSINRIRLEFKVDEVYNAVKDGLLY